MVTWRVEFAPVREADPVVTPPQPKASEQKEPDSSDSSAEINVENPETVVMETGGTDPASPASSETGSPSDGTENAGETVGETVQPIRETERPKSKPDYSGLKRTLLSCGLLIVLAAAAYLVSKFKNRKGGNSNP